ncbi:MAG: glycosyltransferase [Bacteroidota bacterium]|nr:glycosyltransferase [Bacteroidota bacterium]
MARKKTQNNIIFNKSDKDLPNVSILLAVYNEELVIENKIKSTFNTDYPVDKIEFLIGSDASSDKTNEIIIKLKQEYKNLQLIEFEQRTGKAEIINNLKERAKNEVLVLTDANVIFKPDTIYHLLKHYKNDKISLVGGNIINSRFNEQGISQQEEMYISRENKIKYNEGILFGAMIGAFGGCYSIRTKNYSKVPARFFMDDFYITMNVIENGGKCINELDAVCSEDVSNKLSEEFRRKIRISIGNFQNLTRYKNLLIPLFNGVSFSFLSHKVIRWHGPFFLILIFVSNIFLFNTNIFFKITLIGQLLLFIIPFVDSSLRRIKVNITLLRFITHFYFMNLALLLGLFKFLKGVKTNIWQPTQRYQ